MPFLVLNCNTVIIYITIDYIVSIMLLVNCQTVYTCMPIYDTDTNDSDTTQHTEQNIFCCEM